LHLHNGFEGDRFHETDRLELPGPHPEGRAAKPGVSKDRGLDGRRLRPSGNFMSKRKPELAAMPDDRCFPHPLLSRLLTCRGRQVSIGK